MTTSTLPQDHFRDRIAVVTGATRGIGRAIAKALGEAGAQVVALGRTQGGLESLDDEIQAAGGPRATLVGADLRDPDGLDRLGGALYERHGRVDILVGAAGMLGVTTPLAHLEPKVWDQVMAVNLTANYRLIRSLDPLLRAADAGRCLFLTSGAASSIRPFWGAYAASKAGLEAIAETYAQETSHTPVRVAVLNPGGMRTKMRAQAFPGEDPESLPVPDMLAPLALELLRRDLDPPAGVVQFRDWAASIGLNIT